MPEMKAVRAVVGGRVQGVGFRYSTVDQANRHGVTGWVRNMPSGQVEVFAQGPDIDVNQFLAWLAVGPRLASVTGVEVVSAEPDTGVTTFRIRF
jgi:acylphosphatase